MKKRYQTFNNIINLVMLFMLCTSITFIFYTYSETAFPWQQLISFSVYILLAFLINCVCKHIISFIIGQLALVASLFLWSLPVMSMVFTVVLCIFLFVCNIYFGMYHKEMKTIYPAKGFLAAIVVSFLYTPLKTKY